MMAHVQKIGILILASLILCSMTHSSQADTVGTYLRTVEWLVDSSDVVFIGKRIEAGTEVLALLKSTPSCLTSHKVGSILEVPNVDMKNRTGAGEFDEEYYQKSFDISDRAVFFLRLGTDGKAYLSKRISLDKPITIHFQSPGKGDKLDFFGVDKSGTPIPSPVELLRLVRQRIKLGPVVPWQLDREAAEVPHPLRPFERERYGARWGYVSTALSQNDWAFSLCSPICHDSWDATQDSHQAKP